MSKDRKSFVPKVEERQALKWLWDDADFQTRYPALFELLALGLWEGQPRKGATLSLFASDQRLKACLSDRETSQALWVTVEHPVDVLAAVEAALQAGTEPWKATRKGAPGAPF